MFGLYLFFIFPCAYSIELVFVLCESPPLTGISHDKTHSYTSLSPTKMTHSQLYKHSLTSSSQPKIWRYKIPNKSAMLHVSLNGPRNWSPSLCLTTRMTYFTSPTLAHGWKSQLSLSLDFPSQTAQHDVPSKWTLNSYNFTKCYQDPSS